MLYFLWQSLHETKLGLRFDRIMSNHYVYAREFCTGFRKKLFASIDDPEYVCMPRIATLSGWDTQISEIYASSMECAVAAGVEADDDAVGKLQRMFVMHCKVE